MEKSATKHRRIVAVFTGLAIIGFASLIGWFAWCEQHTPANVGPIALAKRLPNEVVAVEKSVLRRSKTDRKVNKVESRPNYAITVRNHVRRDADANDAMAKAIQAYQDTLTCRDYLHQVNASLAKHVPEDPNDPLSTLESTLENLDRVSKEMQRNQELCAGETQESLDKKMVALSLDLGLKGYQPAQACFVAAPYSLLDGYYRKNPALQQQYLTIAPRFTTDLLINGDWGTTMQAKYRLGDMIELYGETQDKWLDQMPLPDPYLVYRSLLLAYYSYPKDPPDQVERNEKSLRKFELKYRFSDEAMAQADAWAQETYLQKYAQMPPRTIDVKAGCSEHATQ